MTIFNLLIIIGIIILVIACLITVIFKTPWNDWKKDIDTTRKEGQKWRKDPFHKFRN